ncbi:MAG: cobalamin biosynthesis protein CobQ [Deltaproteobacteria bacterium DG_8]|nr:MAG: cobalamin biosynthesis protein CobQ [Deltaproteobacteria bacterium DG_8]
MARALMIQGTGSHVGKSLVVTAFCRIFQQRGYRVAPFKAQNMALNSFVTEDGGEMGRAQVVQAEAAGVKPSVDMNPILIKPQSDIGAQIIIQGRVVGNYSAVEYHQYKREAIKSVRESYTRLAKKFDLIMIEGAGSPAEINLKKHDIVNMKVAQLAKAPVLMVSDIDRGGVFASLIGTMELLTTTEKAWVKGFIINKFRGDLNLLKTGLTFLKKKTGVKVLGVIPFIKDIYIPDEDSISLEKKRSISREKGLDVTVVQLPHISNFTDFDPLEREESVALRYVKEAGEIGNPDVLIIPGSKNTIEDLHYLKTRGYVQEINRLKRNGSTIVGICGGFQMLGKTIKDYHGVESSQKSIEGLGLLDIETQFEKKKATYQIEAEEINLTGKGKSRDLLRGYEIHMGKTKLHTEKILFKIKKRSGKKCLVYDGAISRDRKVWGTYIHGIFDNDRFRRRFLNSINKRRKLPLPEVRRSFEYDSFKEEQYDKLADLIRKNLDMNLIYSMVNI